MKTMLLAVGGNSLIRAGEKGTIAEQLANARRTAAEIVKLVRDGYRIVITHGNGPQVGAALLRSERGASQVPGQPLDVCDASTQGEIGYLLQQSLDTELKAAGLQVPVVTILTQVVVSLDDPAMHHPNKPIGPFYSQSDAEQRRELFGWEIVEDAARGYRRVVPSPEPLEIVELDVIRDLVEQNVLVIACGGGGIPVAWVMAGCRVLKRSLTRTRASALLASRLGMDWFVISTDTDYVYLDYRKPSQRPLNFVGCSELQQHFDAGHFPPGNMGPKVESVLRFLMQGGGEAVITSCDNLALAVSGSVGTHIMPERKLAALDARMQLELTVGGR